MSDKITNPTNSLQKKIKRVFFTGQTDINGNVYYSGITTDNNIILQVTASGDHGATAMLNGDGSAWNYHISSYTDWNVGENVSVTVFIEYIDK